MAQPRNRIVGIVVESVISDQLANRALAITDLIDERSELIYRSQRLVVQVRTVDQLPYGAFARVERVDEVINLGENRIQLLNGALAGLDDVGEIRRFVRPEFVIVLRFRADGMFAVEIDHGVAQHADRTQAGLGVLVKRVDVLSAQLHRDFNRRQLAVRHNFDGLHIADRDALERDRRADLQTGGVFKVGADSELAGKQAARVAGHQKNQGSQRQERCKHEDTDF